MMDKNAKIYVAGHRGMVGSAIVRELQKQGYTNIVTRTHKELDLCSQATVEEFFEQEKPEYVFFAAAKVGGVYANSIAHADFLYENVCMELNTMNSAWKNACKKFLFIASACIYPTTATQPISESSLLTGPFEPTDEGYGIAKTVGVKYAQFLKNERGANFISVIPTNLYGIGDNYHKEFSHVIPGMIRKFHEAKESNREFVECWGDGTPTRDFLYVDDLASLCVLMMQKYDGNEIINAGSGEDIPISKLAMTISDVVGYKGEIKWDTAKPNGLSNRRMDITKGRELGWIPETSLANGLQVTYRDFVFSKYRK